jgi:hypothetical protein
MEEFHSEQSKRSDKEQFLGELVQRQMEYRCSNEHNISVEDFTSRLRDKLGLDGNDIYCIFGTDQLTYIFIIKN